MKLQKKSAAERAGKQQSRKQRRQGARRPSRNPRDGTARSGPEPQAQISQLLALATQKAQLGAFVEALHLVDEVLKQAPGHPEALALKGGVLTLRGDYRTAIDSFRKSISADNSVADVHYNLGAAFVKTHQFADAVDPLQRATELNPDLADAFNALGVAYLNLWRFDEADHALTNALRLQHNAQSIYNNLALVYWGMGDPDKAIDFLVKAIEIKPEYTEVYDSLQVPSAVVTCGAGPANFDDVAWERVKRRVEAAVPGGAEPALLKYFCQKHNVEPVSEGLEQAQAAFPSIDDEAIDLAEPQTAGATREGVGPPRQICALLQFGRSATGLVHALLDEHPAVTSLPGSYLKGFFGRQVWPKIRHPHPETMIRNFMDLYKVLFDANLPSSVPGVFLQGDARLGFQEGFTAMGPDRNAALGLDRLAFQAHLHDLVGDRRRVTQGDFFLLVHRAFELALGRPAGQDTILYHLHNPDTYEFANYVRQFPATRLLMMVREPLQSCESWLKKDFDAVSSYGTVANKIAAMLLDISRPECHGRDAFGLRLEDLKRRPDATMRALAARLGIDWDPCLLEPTMQGLQWWGDPTSNTFGLDPFDTGVIEREVGAIFGESDQLILRTLYYPFRVLYGYQGADEDAFRADLDRIEPMLDEPMACERKLMEKAALPLERLPQHTSYKYLRLVLRSRLETLKRYGTYPGMIEPMDVGA